MSYTRDQAEQALRTVQQAVQELQQREPDFSKVDREALDDFLRFWKAVTALRVGFKAVVTGLGLLAALVASVVYLSEKARAFWQ